MKTATATSKSQISTPGTEQKTLCGSAGDRVKFVEESERYFKGAAGTRSVTALKGMFGVAQKVVSIEEMNFARVQPQAGGNNGV